ncbi:MAG: hypothetical protein NDJ89_15645 [Oligoflexia bacterium]|nr:hypothetical protein [Oligoflexia bacterium]
MRNATSFSSIGILLLSVLLLSSCGGQGSPGSRKRQSANFAPAVDSTAPMTTSTGGSGGDLVVETPKLGIPPLSLRVGTAGYNSVTVTVKARNLLKVRFVPGVQDETVSGSGFSPKYSGLGVYVTVGSNTETTPLLYNGVFGGAAEKSSIFDFSNSFDRTCATGDTECKESVTITVSKPNYDYWCVNYGYYCGYWTHIEPSHPWHGTLEIQTESTDALE